MTLAKRITKALHIGSTLVLVLLVSLTSSVSVHAYPTSFDPETIFYDSDLYTLPAIFVGKSRAESIALIQNILAQDNATLATASVPINIEDAGYTFRHPEVQPYLNTTVSAAEAIWSISQENLGKGTWNNMQITEGINPLLLMAIIQKESGIIYGKCARDTCFDQSTSFRIARATGYACYDGQPCKDEFLGFFSQVYFTARWYKAFTKYCKDGFRGYGQDFQTGKAITLEGTTLTFGSNITCATYYYTPHVSPQRNFYNTLVDISNRAGAANTPPPPSTPISPPPVVPPPIVVTTPPAPVESISVSIVPQTTTSPTPLITGTFGEAGVTATIQFGNEDPIAISQINGTDWSYQVKFPKPNGTYELKVHAKSGVKTGEDTSQNELVIQPAVTAPLAPDLVEFTVATGNKRGEVAPTAAPAGPEITLDTIKVEPVAPPVVASSAPKKIVKQDDPLSDLFAQQRNKEPLAPTTGPATSYSFASLPHASVTPESAADTKTPLVILASTLTLALSLIAAQIVQARRKKRALISWADHYFAEDTVPR
jgi:hypothetical protein